MQASPLLRAVMHCLRWRKQRSRNRARNVSNAPLATVGAVGLMRAVEDQRLYGEYKVSSNTQTEFHKEREREGERESEEISQSSR